VPNPRSRYASPFGCVVVVDVVVVEVVDGAAVVVVVDVVVVEVVDGAAVVVVVWRSSCRCSRCGGS
jgi:hypothetical protein